MIISILNAVLRLILGAMSHFEKAHTETERLKSAVNKMWLVQYINIAIILLLTGTSHNKIIDFKKDNLYDWAPIFSGKHVDSDPLWY